MTLNRRDFVASVGCSFLASTAARAHVSWPSATALAKDYFDWATVRAEFDLSPEWLHFSQFSIVSHPRPVRAAIEYNWTSTATVTPAIALNMVF